MTGQRDRRQRLLALVSDPSAPAELRRALTQPIVGRKPSTRPQARPRPASAASGPLAGLSLAEAQERRRRRAALAEQPVWLTEQEACALADLSPVAFFAAFLNPDAPH